MNGIGAVALGVITATGGGVLRDVLAREEPSLFRADSVLYGIPAALGAIVVVVSWRTETYQGAVGAAVAAGVFALRIAALRFGWHAPRPLPQRWSTTERSSTARSATERSTTERSTTDAPAHQEPSADGPDTPT